MRSAQHVAPPLPLSPRPDAIADDKGKAKATDTTEAECPDTSSGSSAAQEDEGGEEEWCLICHTSPVEDRSVLPRCLHAQFCFACIVRWCTIRRCCPLCQTDVGDHLIHAIRADDDYLRFHLPPTIAAASFSTGSTAGVGGSRREMVSAVQRARHERHAGRTSDAGAERAIDARKYVYRNGLYARHVGSNRHTHYRAAPTPAQIKHDATTGGERVVRRIALFVRRELQCWPHVDADFVTRYLVSLLQVFALASDEAVRLLGEFLGEATARHLLHELECFLRSGKSNLDHYAASPWLQYPSGPTRGRGQSTRQEERDGSGSSHAQLPRGEVQRRQVLLERLERERSLLDRSTAARQAQHDDAES